MLPPLSNPKEVLERFPAFWGGITSAATGLAAQTLTIQTSLETFTLACGAIVGLVSVASAMVKFFRLLKPKKKSRDEDLHKVTARR